MKKFLTGGIALLALAAATSSQAADLPSSASPTARAAAQSARTDNWYLGGNLGYSWGTSKTTTIITANTTQSFSNSTDLDGWVGGLQLGYNWLRPQWMFGIEGDFDLTGQKGTSALACGALLCTNTTAVAGAAAIVTSSFEQKLKWLGTIRGRVGPMLSPTSFVYLTGGWAIGRVKTEGNFAGFSAGAAITGPFDNSTTKSGWTIGGGIEGRVSGNWTAKLEYLYVDLGTISFTASLPANAPPLTGAFSSKVTDNIVRLGLNYQFK